MDSCYASARDWFRRSETPSSRELLEAARRREIDVVHVWRLDRRGRSVTDLLATLKELEHLGVGFVSLTEALDLTTAAGRAMAGLLAIFAEFEREILRERTRAGLLEARRNGKRLGRPITAGFRSLRLRTCIGPAWRKLTLPADSGSAALRYAAFWQQNHEKSRARSCPGKSHPQRSDRRCLPGRASNELVLLSGKQDQLPIPSEVCNRERRLPA